MEKPRYLQSITENNSPRFDWGPKKKANHYGLYSHLKQGNGMNPITVEYGSPSSNGLINEQYRNDDDIDDRISHRSDSNLKETKF